MSSILKGIKVVDAGSFLAGPCAATIMSDYGANVLKVEPLTGDRHRTISAGHPIDHSWQLTGRNKRSLALDIAQPDGRDVLLSLVRDADVLVVNFSAGRLKRFGLTFEELHPLNPRLILAQISGYGLQGPDADRRAFDLTGWFARTGIQDMMRDKDIPPALPAGGVGDHATALSLFSGIMLALFKREQTGLGSMVDTSLAATGTWANGLNLQATLSGADAVARRDAEGWSSPFTNVYRCADDRFVLLGMQNAKQGWPLLADALDHPEWLEDARFANVRSVFKHRFEARAMIADAIAQLPIDDLSRRLDERGLVFSKVYQNAEVINDEQLIANGVIVSTESTEPGYDRTLATPFNLSGEQQRTPALAPRVGEHSRAILAEHGYEDDAISALIAQGIVGAGSADA